MSLMRLLTVGRSLGPVKNHKFRAPDDSGKSFTKIWAAEPRQRPGPAPLKQAPPARAEGTGVKRLDSSWKKIWKRKQDMSVQTLKAEAGERKTPVEGVAKTAFPLGRWSMLKNPFVRKAEDVRSAPMQGELSLDLVKPVRNDLHDADLEVLPARKEAVGLQDKAPASTEKHEAIPYLWSRLSARLFRTQRS